MPLPRAVRPLAAPLLCAAFAACAPAVESSSSAASAALPGTEWRLVELDGRTPPPGDAGRAATLLLAEGGASGFSGCNVFSGGYTLSGDSLRFGALASTRKACATGMELEHGYLAALEAARAYRLTAEGLELRGDAGVVARFAAAPEARP